MKKLILYTIICLQTAGSWATNQGDRLLDSMQNHGPVPLIRDHRSLWRTVDSQARLNPALHGAAFSTSLSELSLAIDHRQQSEAFVLEKGEGYTLPSLGVETFLKLSERTSVWGAASYTTGRHRQVTWNSTSDYDLLQPYVLADTLGGNTHSEQYRFSGGYATRLQQWLLGAEMQVKAEQEYRDQDPRMRGVVTELQLRLGAGRDMGAYCVGAAFEGNIYKQTNSVDFYNEEGVIPEYQMTGLGTEYSRFSGDKRSLYYDGGGVAMLLNAHPIDEQGFYADVSIDEHRYHRKLAEYNSMPLTDLYREHTGATIGWRHTGKSQWAVYGKADYTKRTGDEHIGGTSNARYFPVIACLTMYKNHLLQTAIGAIFGHGSCGQLCDQEWHVSAEAGYRSQTEEYVYPQRQMDCRQLYSELNGQWLTALSSLVLLTVEGHAAYTAHLDDKVVLPYANMDAKTVALMNHKRDYANASYTDVGACLRADYALSGGRYGLFAQMAAAAVFCSLGSRQLDLHASIGITF